MSVLRYIVITGTDCNKFQGPITWGDQAADGIHCVRQMICQSDNTSVGGNGSYSVDGQLKLTAPQSRLQNYGSLAVGCCAAAFFSGDGTITSTGRLDIGGRLTAYFGNLLLAGAIVMEGNPERYVTVNIAKDSTWKVDAQSTVYLQSLAYTFAMTSTAFELIRSNFTVNAGSDAPQMDSSTWTMTDSSITLPLTDVHYPLTVKDSSEVKLNAVDVMMGRDSGIMVQTSYIDLSYVSFSLNASSVFSIYSADLLSSVTPTRKTVLKLGNGSSLTISNALASKYTTCTLLQDLVVPDGVARTEKDFPGSLDCHADRRARKVKKY